VKEQIEGWASEYMSMWPDLLEKQQESYRDISEDWRNIAEKRVFPFLPSRLNPMKEAHANLIECIKPLHKSAMKIFNIDNIDILYVIYVGIGSGTEPGERTLVAAIYGRIRSALRTHHNGSEQLARRYRS